MEMQYVFGSMINENPDERLSANQQLILVWPEIEAAKFAIGNSDRLVEFVAYCASLHGSDDTKKSLSLHSITIEAAQILAELEGNKW